MARAPFQVLVLPYKRIRGRRVMYAVFRRTRRTGGYWQFIAGGGEGNETPLAAARREAFEEAAIPRSSRFTKLGTVVSIPAYHFPQARWKKDVLVVPEYSFAVEIGATPLVLSSEHTQLKWLSYEAAARMLRWDSNKTALWELDGRLRTTRTAARKGSMISQTSGSNAEADP